MSGKNDLTQGSVGKNLVLFALPYLLSSFMQTFYGMADLFVVGLYNGSETTTAVSVGSQVMHMLTVIIIGFVMGTTVWIGQCVGAKDEKTAAKTAGTSALFFSVFAVAVTALLLLCTACGSEQEAESGSVYDIYYVNNEETNTLTRQYVSETTDSSKLLQELLGQLGKIGRASCRERV